MFSVRKVWLDSSVHPACVLCTCCPAWGCARAVAVLLSTLPHCSCHESALAVCKDCWVFECGCAVLDLTDSSIQMTLEQLGLRGADPAAQPQTCITLMPPKLK